MEKLFNITIEKSVFLKGVAIIFVLLGHYNYIYDSGSWGVVLFLILSGYGVFSSFKKKGLNKFFTNKLKKVYMPYLLVTIFFIGYYIIKNLKHFSKKLIVFSLLGLDCTFSFDKTMWYISFLFIEYFIFFFVAFFCKLIIKNTKKCNNLIVLFNFLINGFFFSLLELNNCINLIWNTGAYVQLYFLSFSFGVLLNGISNVNINSNLKRIIFKVIIWVLSLILFSLYYSVSDFTYKIYCYTMPIILILLSEYNVLNFKNKIICFFGRFSYDIYLWEGFFLLIKDSWFGFLQLKVLIDAISILVTILLAYYYKKYIINSLINNNVILLKRN